MVLALFCLLMLKPKSYYNVSLEEIRADYTLPKNLKRGLLVNAQRRWATFVKPMQGEFLTMKKAEGTKQALKGIETPMAMIKAMEKPKKFALFPYLKYKKLLGTPNCKNYPTKLRAKIVKLSQEDAISAEAGKRSISVFAKAELDLRQEEQEKRLQALLNKGITLCWLSSHADCSERCAPWQGKLVDIRHRSSRPSFRLYKEGGYQVYSLPSIMEQVDKYGYKNNIINGFNCRHHLIPYYRGSKPPRKFTGAEIRIEREITSRLREREREIRSLKRQAMLYNVYDEDMARRCLDLAESKEKEARAFAKNTGQTWHAYRTEV